MRVSTLWEQIEQTFRVGRSWADNPVANGFRVVRRQFDNWWGSATIGTKNEADEEEEIENREASIYLNDRSGREYSNSSDRLKEFTQERQIKINNSSYEFQETFYKRHDRYLTEDSQFWIQTILNTQISQSEIEDLRESIRSTSEKALNFRIVLPVNIGFEESDFEYDAKPQNLYIVSRKDSFESLKRDLYHSELQIACLLQEVLQSLEYLHHHCELIPNTLGIAHGDLTLDRLAEDKSQQEDRLQKIYLCHLKIFDFQQDFHHFTRTAEKENDLKQLGYSIDNFLQSQNLDIPSNEFKQFLQNLKKGRYKTAREASSKLAILQKKNKLANQPQFNRTTSTYSYRQPINVHSLKIFKYLILFFSIGFILVFGLNLIEKTLLAPTLSPNATQRCSGSQPCRIASIFEPPINFNSNLAYHSGENWRQIWEEDNRIENRASLEEIFKERGMKLDTRFESNRNLSQISIVPEINMSSIEGQKDAIASDGFVVFVANTEAENGERLPQLLQGQILLEDLRNIYTGNLTRWSDVQGIKKRNKVDREIQIYFHNEENALENKFEQLLNTQSDRALTSKILRTSSMMETIGKVANPENYAIGIARVGDVFEQCSVYPLAIVRDDGKVIQAFVQANRNPIDLETDLCLDKGSYFPDRRQFTAEKYPLSYRWIAAYSEGENAATAQAFIEMLKTQEGQDLLKEAGLIPLPESQL